MTAVNFKGEDSGLGFTWTATLESPCHEATLTYAPSNWPAPYQYIASFSGDVQTILDNDVASSELTVTCPYAK